MKYIMLTGIITLLILASCEDGLKKSADIDADPMYLMLLDSLATIDSLGAIGFKCPDGTEPGFFFNTDDWHVWDENGNRYESYQDRIWLRPEPDTFWIDMIRTDWNDQSWSYHVPYLYTWMDSIIIYRNYGVGYDTTSPIENWALFAQLIIIHLNEYLEKTYPEQFRTDL